MSTKPTGNRKEIVAKGHLYVVTRRIIQRKASTVLRVRVQVYKGLIPHGDPEMNESRDYEHLGKGDAAFHRIIRQVQKFGARK